MSVCVCVCVCARVSICRTSGKDKSGLPTSAKATELSERSTGLAFDSQQQ